MNPALAGEKELHMMKAELKKMAKAELAALAKAHGLDTTGTKEELIKRLVTSEKSQEVTEENTEVAQESTEPVVSGITEESSEPTAEEATPTQPEATADKSAPVLLDVKAVYNHELLKEDNEDTRNNVLRMVAFLVRQGELKAVNNSLKSYNDTLTAFENENVVTEWTEMLYKLALSEAGYKEYSSLNEKKKAISDSITELGVTKAMFDALDAHDKAALKYIALPNLSKEFDGEDILSIKYDKIIEVVKSFFQGCDSDYSAILTQVKYDIFILNKNGTIFKGLKLKPTLEDVKMFTSKFILKEKQGDDGSYNYETVFSKSQKKSVKDATKIINKFVAILVNNSKISVVDDTTEEEVQGDK